MQPSGFSSYGNCSYGGFIHCTTCCQQQKMQNEHDELFYLWIWRNLKCNRLWCLLYLLASQAGNHRASRFHAGRLRAIHFHGWDTTLQLNSICFVKIHIAKVEMCIILFEKRWSHEFCTKKAREAKKNPINWNLWWIQDAPFFDGRSGLIWVELCTKATELPAL